MKRVLVTSAGGAPSANFIRSLRDAPESFWIVGVDANKYTLQRSEADENYLVPYADDQDYLPVLSQIINKTDVSESIFSSFLSKPPFFFFVTIERCHENLITSC